jgi:hypothetical protein
MPRLLGEMEEARVGEEAASGDPARIPREGMRENPFPVESMETVRYCKNRIHRVKTPSRPSRRRQKNSCASAARS